MPLTLKLSRQFYDRPGEDVANEFVNALNSVDAAYRTELRDTVDQRFSQFETRIEAKFGELRTELATGLADVKSGLKWMYAFWAPTALAILTVAIAILALLLRT